VAKLDWIAEKAIKGKGCRESITIHNNYHFEREIEIGRFA